MANVRYLLMTSSHSLGMEMLARSFSNVKTLDISKCSIGSVGGAALFEQLADINMEALDVSLNGKNKAALLPPSWSPSPKKKQKKKALWWVKKEETTETIRFERYVLCIRGQTRCDTDASLNRLITFVCICSLQISPVFHFGTKVCFCYFKFSRPWP